MTTTDRPAAHQRPEQQQQTTPDSITRETGAPAVTSSDRELWDAYRLQQQRRHCPTCGEACDAIY